MLAALAIAGAGGAFLTVIGAALREAFAESLASLGTLRLIGRAALGSALAIESLTLAPLRTLEIAFGVGVGLLPAALFEALLEALLEAFTDARSQLRPAICALRAVLLLDGFALLPGPLLVRLGRERAAREQREGGR